MGVGKSPQEVAHTCPASTSTRTILPGIGECTAAALATPPAPAVALRRCCACNSAASALGSWERLAANCCCWESRSHEQVGGRMAAFIERH